MVIYAQGALGESISFIRNERTCRCVKNYCERTVVVFIGHCIRSAVRHEGVPSRRVTNRINFFALEIFEYEVLESRLRAYGIAVRIIMAMYYYAVIPRNE